MVFPEIALAAGKLEKALGSPRRRESGRVLVEMSWNLS